MNIKGKKQQAIKRGKLPFKQELFCSSPQGKEFPWKPHTGQSYHSTSSTFNCIAISHTLPVSLTNTHMQIFNTHQLVRRDFCCFTRCLLYTDKNTHIKRKNCHPKRMSLFNERMPRGISWHQPNDQATAHAGKCDQLKLTIIRPTLQLKLWHFTGEEKRFQLTTNFMSNSFLPDFCTSVWAQERRAHVAVRLSSRLLGCR